MNRILFSCFILIKKVFKQKSRVARDIIYISNCILDVNSNLSLHESALYKRLSNIITRSNKFENNVLIENAETFIA